MKYQRLKNLVGLVTAAGYFAATFPGQKMKLRILCEKLLIISQRFFGIPPGPLLCTDRRNQERSLPNQPGPPEKSPPSLQLELLLGWGRGSFVIPDCSGERSSRLCHRHCRLTETGLPP